MPLVAFPSGGQLRIIKELVDSTHFLLVELDCFKRVEILASAKLYGVGKRIQPMANIFVAQKFDDKGSNELFVAGFHELPRE